jgi:ribosomal protein S21
LGIFKIGSFKRGLLFEIRSGDLSNNPSKKKNKKNKKKHKKVPLSLKKPSYSSKTCFPYFFLFSP